MFMMVAFVLALLVGSWLRQAKLLLKIRVSSNPEI
jgi:hypothetical protein